MMLPFILTVVVFTPFVLASPFVEKKGASPGASLTEDKLLKNQISDAKNAAAFNKLLSHIAKVNEERLSSMRKLASLQSINPYPNLSASLRSYLEPEDSDSSDSDSDSDSDNVVYLVIPDQISLKSGRAQVTNVSEDPPETAPKLPQLQPNTTDFLEILQPVRTRVEPVRTRIETVQIKPLKAEKKTHKKHSEVKESDNPKSLNESINVSLNKDGWEFLRQSIERSCKSREVKRCKRACKAAVSSACQIYDCRKKLKKSLKKNCKYSCKDEFSNSW